MSFASKYSHATPLFNVRIKEPAYTSLADLFSEYGKDHVFPIAAIYINRLSDYFFVLGRFYEQHIEK